jgi:D-arabinose 1-dehydrogenase-like Zn-dependent alcohol dehydrogenase
MSPLVGGLAVKGRMITIGVGNDPIEISPLALVFGRRSVEGALTGSTIDGEETLSFSALENIRPMIETVPLEKAPEAYARMMRGEARFRMVLLTGQ